MPEEQRIDPEDGKVQTLAVLRTKYGWTYNQEDIDEYWETTCMPLEPELGMAGLPDIHVKNDPFLTHSTRQPRAPSAASSEYPFLTHQRQADARPAEPTLKEDPFMTHKTYNEGGNQGLQEDPFGIHGQYASADARATYDEGDNQGGQALARPPWIVQEDAFMAHGQVNVEKDPFMTQGVYVPLDARANYSEGGHQGQKPPVLVQAFRQAQQKVRQALHAFLGPGVADRKLPVRNVLVLGPWSVFIWMVLVWVLLQHFSLNACVLLTAVLCGGCFCMIFAWYTGKRCGPVSFLPLGVLCLLGIVSGVLVGQIGWDQHWRSYWWLQTGHRMGNTSASTPALSRTSSAVIGFMDEGGKTIKHSAVDYMRSAGFKDGHYYCVAPVLNPEMAASSLTKVNYWAIGIDCCSELGSFSCDASRSYNGGYGITVLDEGYPCPGCSKDRFRAAIAKAEAMHGLLSAPGALYIRWVSDVPALELGMLLRALVFILLSAILSLLAFFGLGSVAWYYGIGHRRFGETGPLLDSASRPKQSVV